MADVLNFMGWHPYLTFFLFALATQFIYSLFSRMFRAMNIRKHGWPPAHCDADGDFRKVR